MQQLRALVGALHASFGPDHFPPTMSWTFGTVNGFETLVVTTTSAYTGDTSVYYFSVRELPAGQTLPASSMIREAGFCGGATYSMGYEPTINPDWTTLCTEILNYLVQVKADIVAAWSDGGIVASIDHEKTLFLASAGVGCQVMLFETEGDIIPCWEQWQAMYSYRASPDTASETVISALAPQGTVVMVPAPSQGLVEAVQSLALVDTEISFNNGATVYSVKSRSVTSP